MQQLARFGVGGGRRLPGAPGRRAIRPREVSTGSVRGSGRVAGWRPIRRCRGGGAARFLRAAYGSLRRVEGALTGLAGTGSAIDTGSQGQHSRRTDETRAALVAVRGGQYRWSTTLLALRTAGRWRRRSVVSRPSALPHRRPVGAGRATQRARAVVLPKRCCVVAPTTSPDRYYGDGAAFDDPQRDQPHARRSRRGRARARSDRVGGEHVANRKAGACVAVDRTVRRCGRRGERRWNRQASHSSRSAASRRCGAVSACGR